jgi:hypothetical protein
MAQGSRLPCKEGVRVGVMPNALTFLSTGTGAPDAVQVCAVSRTDGIATRGGRSSGPMTPRRTTDLDPKGRGDKSMLVKRGTAEDVYAVVLQRLSDRAKTGLCES